MTPANFLRAAIMMLGCAVVFMGLLIAGGCGTPQHQGGRKIVINPDCSAIYDSASGQVVDGNFSLKRGADGSCEVSGGASAATQGRESSVSTGTGDAIKETPGTIKTFLPVLGPLF